MTDVRVFLENDRALRTPFETWVVVGADGHERAHVRFPSGRWFTVYDEGTGLPVPRAFAAAPTVRLSVDEVLDDIRTLEGLRLAALATRARTRVGSPSRRKDLEHL